MTHEKIFKRADGTRYKVFASLFIDSMMDTWNWKFWVHKCDPKKKKFYTTADTNSFEFRKLSGDQKRAYIENKYLQHVTPEEVLETKMELWQLIKPTL